MADHAPEDSTDVNPHRLLLADAAAEIRADQIAREKARPQNVGEGTARFVGDALSGVALGAAALVMGPYQGYKQSGPKGIVGGTLGGIAVGVATTTLGLGSGIASFAQGASRTAQKINPPSRDPRLVVVDDDHAAATDGADASTDRAKLRDSNASADANASARSFNEETVNIKEVYFAERKLLYAELMADYSAESTAASMDGLAPPVDNELYHVLDVEVDATPAQIRKAYYRMAQKYHPDKHPDDPEATEKFQQVGQAYQYVSPHRTLLFTSHSDHAWNRLMPLVHQYQF